MSLLTRLPFNFSGSAYTPPASSLAFNFVTVTTQYLCLDGADSLQLGSVSLTQKPGAVAAGFAATGYGSTTVQYSRRYVYPPGIITFSSLEQYIATTRILTATTIGSVTAHSSFASVFNSYYRWPDGGYINFAFFGAYTAPGGNALSIDFTQGNVFRYVGPYGYSFTQYGTPATRRLQEFIQPSGFTQFGSGTASIASTRVPLYPSGFSATQFGTLSIKYTQFVRPGGLASLSFGTAFVSHYVRYLEQHYPWEGVMGAPTVIFRTRTIEVPWSVFTQYGTALVGRHVNLPVQGFTETRYGQPDVSYANVLFPTGIDSAQIGTYRVSRSPQVVFPVNSQDSQTFGGTTVYNLRQYITQLYDLWYDSPYNRGFGFYTGIENRNKYLGVFGFEAGRVGIASDIYLKARVALVLGIAPGGDPQVFQIAHFLRWLRPEGYDSQWVPLYNTVYNSAMQLKPSGFDALRAGTPLNVESNLQTIRHHTPSDTEFGALVCGIKIRTVTQTYSRDGSALGFPWTSAVQRYLSPPGINAGGMGVPAALGPFFTIIAPRWLKGPDKFGDGYIKNKIPQAFTRGHDSLEVGPGLPWISFRVRSLFPTSFQDGLFGRHAIKDRRQWLYPVGSLTQAMALNIHVALANPNLPSTREIFPNGFCLGFRGGRYFWEDVFGKPSLQSSPFPEGIDGTQWGDTWIRNQGCITQWYYPDSTFLWGTPSLSGPQYVGTIPDPEFGHTQWGSPRLSPWTIWATLDTPQQAVENHKDGDKFYELDTRNGYGQPDAGPWFGRPQISDRIRYLFHVHGAQDTTIGTMWGTQKIELSRRFIKATTWASAEYGYPKLPFRQRSFAYGWDSAELGPDLSLVHDPLNFTQYLSPEGQELTQWGATDPQLWIRNLYARGYVATEWGDNTPMVHFPRKVYPTGYVASQFGSAFTAFRIRYLAPTSDDYLRMEPSYDTFDLSDVRIFNKTYPAAVTGADSQVFGKTSIYNTHQFIRPYQIVGSRCMGHHVTVQGV